MAKGERQRFRHIALAGMGGADPIAEERALGRTADDLVQVDGAQDRAVGLPADQEFFVASALGAPQPRHEELAGGLAARGGRLPAPEEGRAPASQGHVLALVARGGASQVDALADLERAAERRWAALRHHPSLSERSGLWPPLARRGDALAHGRAEPAACDLVGGIRSGVRRSSGTCLFGPASALVVTPAWPEGWYRVRCACQPGSAGDVPSG